MNDQFLTQLEPSPSSQYELEPASQFDWVAGRHVPRLSVERVTQTPTQSTDARQTVLRLTRELQLQLPVERSIHSNGECQRGVKATWCQHTKEKHSVTVVPLFCGKGNCKKSEQRNGNRRVDRLLNGLTEKVNDMGELKSLGINKLVSAYDLGVMVFTLPAHLRLLLSSTEYLNRWNRACYKLLVRMLRKNSASKEAIYAVKCYLHPTNDEGKEYKPHLNYIFPLVYLKDGKAYKQKSYFPRSWLKETYWREEYKKEVEKEFGFSIFEGLEEKEVNFFYEVRSKDHEKYHAIKYFSRQFSGFTKLNGKRWNPRSLGLLSPKHVADLQQLLELVPDVPAYAKRCTVGTAQNEPCEWRELVADNEAALAGALKRAGFSAPRQYLEERTEYGGGCLDPPPLPATGQSAKQRSAPPNNAIASEAPQLFSWGCWEPCACQRVTSYPTRQRKRTFEAKWLRM